MKIIYNEKEAINKKKTFDEEIKATKNRTDRRQTIICVSAFIIAAGIIAGVFQLTWCQIGDPFLIMPSAFGLLIFICAAAYTACVIVDEREEPDDVYTADVKYCIVSRDKTVLKTDARTDERRVGIYLDLEDENGLVNTQLACYLRPKSSTRVDEETADLPNGLYLIPYKKSEIVSED